MDAVIGLEGHPFEYAVRVLETDSGPKVVELHIISPEGGPVAIELNDLRRIPVKRLAHVALAARTGDLFAMLSDPAQVRGGFPEPETQPSKRPGRHGHTDEFYDRIAELWHQARDSAVNVRGLAVYEFIAQNAPGAGDGAFSRNTAKKWVSDARKNARKRGLPAF